MEGIEAAIRTFYALDKKISLYVFGDEFSGNAIQPVIDQVDRINKATKKGCYFLKYFKMPASHPQPLANEHDLTNTTVNNNS